MGNQVEKGGLTASLYKIIAQMLGGFSANNAQSGQKPYKPSKQEGQVTVNKIDPRILEQIEQLKRMVQQSQQLLQEARRQAMKASNPLMYKQQKQIVFTAFLDNLKQYKFTETLPKNGRKFHMVIGPISVGKSCLLNRFLGLKLKTGVGETTDKAMVVASNGQIDILDSPGVNDDFNFYDIKTLALFHCVDRVFVLYRTCLKDIKDIVRIMAVIKPDETYLVRTQCDNFSENDFKDLDQQLKIDRQYAQQVIGHKFSIFATSARMDQKFADNKIVAQLITGNI